MEFWSKPEFRKLEWQRVSSVGFSSQDQVLELLGCFFPVGLTWLVAYSGSPVSHLSSSCTCTSGCLLAQLPWAGHWGAPLIAADRPVARSFIQGDRATDPSWEQLRPQISYSNHLNAKFTGLSPVKIAHSSEFWIVLGSTGKHMLAQKYLAFKVFFAIWFTSSSAAYWYIKLQTYQDCLWN